MRPVFPNNLLEGFTFEELCALIECESVLTFPMADGQTMVTDLAGRAKGLLANFRATVLYQEGRGTGFAIVGNVVLCLPTELK